MSDTAGRSSVRTLSSLVVGIDFGTTYSGIAFLHTLNSSVKDAPDEIDVNKIAENIKVIKEWPDATGAHQEKIPTILAYPKNANAPVWGARVRASMKPRIEFFKLGLEPKAATFYGFLEGFQSTTPFGTHPALPGKGPVDFVADYLQGLFKFLQESYLRGAFADVFLQSQTVSYILTVPAIWTDAAKSLTRQAAVRAGIPDDKIMLVTEPEAAAFYCATQGTTVDLADGEDFLVCDAGGGTVVCVLFTTHS